MLRMVFHGISWHFMLTACTGFWKEQVLLPATQPSVVSSSDFTQREAPASLDGPDSFLVQDL